MGPREAGPALKRLGGVAIFCWVGACVVWSLGWVNSLSALSLTAPEGESLGVALLKSVVVLMAWFGAVMVAPVLMLTACTGALVTALAHRGIHTIERTGSNTTASASTKNDAAT